MILPCDPGRYRRSAVTVTPEISNTPDTPDTPAMDKPAIRVVRHLARTGGTLISKCLAVMHDTVMLSEIHPRGIRQINPLTQAMQWFGLVTTEEAIAMRERSRHRPMSFLDVIVEIEERARLRGQSLVIREWSHIDYHGVPFVEPSYRPEMLDILSQRYRVLETSSVRHPVDEWLSLRKLPIMQGKLTVPAYLEGCLRFAEDVQHKGFVRYEDFTRDPDAHLRHMCAQLELPFDPTYTKRWATYQFMTGDTQGSRGGLEEIRPLTRRPAPEHILAQFTGNPAYERTLQILGYDPD